MERFLNKLFWFFLPFGQEIVVGIFSVSIAQWIGALMVIIKLLNMRYGRLPFFVFLALVLLHIVHLNFAEFPIYVIRNLFSVVFVYFAFNSLRTYGLSIEYLVMGSILSSFFFLNQYFGFDNFHALGKSPHGLMMNRNDYVLAQLIVIFLLMNSNVKGRVLAVLVLSTTIFISGSRSTSLILVIYFLYQLISSLQITMLLKLMVLPAIVILSLVYVSLNSRFSALDNGKDKSLLLRIAVAERALDLWSDQPVLGIGFGQFRPNSIEENGIKLNTHNTYLQFLVESGLVGLLGLGAFLIYTLFKSLYYKELLAIYANLFVIDVLSTWAVLIPIFYILSNVDLYNRSWSFRY